MGSSQHFHHLSRYHKFSIQSQQLYKMALPVAQRGLKSRSAMKSKRVSKVARGRFAKALVFRGSRSMTSGGLKSDDLMKNKRGKIVSKRLSARGKRAFRNVEDWIESVMEARSALHVSGFLAINGKSLQGKALYVKARAIRAGKRSVLSRVPLDLQEANEVVS